MFPNRIAKTTLEDGTVVSTVDAFSFLVRSPETCVFYPNGDSEVVKVYASPADAFTGHHKIVAKLVCKLYAMPYGAKLSPEREENA